jgi:hypothetical protein
MTVRRKKVSALRAAGFAFASAGVLIALSIPWAHAVIATLEDDHGFTAVVLERTGPFNFKFSATRGLDQCWGSVTKTPGAEFRLGEVCVAPKR